jgi:hypothetical protein
MIICKGVVRDNVVVLESGVHLPDGIEVARYGSWNTHYPVMRHLHEF